MTETVIENYTTNTTLEVIESTGVTVENVAGTTTVIEVPNASTQDVISNVLAAATLEVSPPTTIELETFEGTTIEVMAATGLTGRAPELHSGAAPPSEAVGLAGDLYLVNTGATIGDLFQKTVAGWGTSKGNLRGGVASVNGLSGTNIVIGANHITTGVLPLAQIPTGTTVSTVALGNHLHTGTYEPVITGGLTTQFWRGDKTWMVIDKASLGLGNVVNVDTTNAGNIVSGTVDISRLPTGTGSTQIALGNHHHDSVYFKLADRLNATFTGIFTVSSAGNNGIEVGRTDGVASTPFIDFHSGATASDHDVRIIASGGTGSNGGGTLTIAAATLTTAAALSTTTSFFTPALRVGSSATAGYVLTADASGNATWQQTANIITPGTTAQYYRGDLTWQTLDKAAVGLANVVNAAQVELTGNQTIAGTKTFSSEIVGPSTGNVLRVGDDSRLADVNAAHAVGVVSQTDAAQGGVVFGSNPTNFRIFGNGSAGTITASTGLGISASLVTITGPLTVTGTITGSGSGLTALPAGSLTGSIAFALLPVGTGASQVAAGNHAHAGVYEPVLAAGATSQYYRGDKTWQALTAAAVGLGNVANVVQVDLASGQTITGAKVLNNASNVFTGNGAGLTALNATQLTTGIAPQARVTPNIQRFVFTTGSEARPTNTQYVEWVGPVLPVNATNDDVWTDTSVATIEDPLISMPIATIQMYAASSAPTNWLVCNGQAISRITYAALWNLIGITYGAGDGTNTFNLPNLQGRVPVGHAPGNTKFDTMGETGGAETVALTEANLAAHVHTLKGHAWNWGGGGSPTVYAQNAPAVGGTPPGNELSTVQNINNTSNSTGTGTGHENMPPYITLQYIIKVL